MELLYEIMPIKVLVNIFMAQIPAWASEHKDISEYCN